MQSFVDDEGADVNGSFLEQRAVKSALLKKSTIAAKSKFSQAAIFPNQSIKATNLNNHHA